MDKPTQKPIRTVIKAHHVQVGDRIIVHQTILPVEAIRTDGKDMYMTIEGEEPFSRHWPQQFKLLIERTPSN